MLQLERGTCIPEEAGGQRLGQIGITDKLGALQDQFKQIVVNIQEKQREELGTFMESLNFPASPNSSSPKQIYKK